MSSLRIPPFRGIEPGLGEDLGAFRGVLQGPTGEDFTSVLGDGLGQGYGRSKVVATWGKLREAEKQGEPASRQLSRSHFVPSSLEGYGRHLRQIQCEGYLKRRSQTTGAWRRRYFLLKDGYLSYFQDQDEADAYRSGKDSQLHHHPSSQRRLAMDTVEAVRTEEKAGPLTFRVISSHRNDLVLRAESKEAITEWRWGFFSSQQSIIARYMEAGGDSFAEERDWRLVTHEGVGGLGRTSGDSRELSRTSGGSEIRKVMGHGHGRARRLTLRQYPLGHSFNSLRTHGPRAPVNRGGYGGSHKRTASCGSKATIGGGIRGCRGGVVAAASKPNGARGCCGTDRCVTDGTYTTENRTGGNDNYTNGARPPKPLYRGQTYSQALKTDRRRRAESMGGFGCSMESDGAGAWSGAPPLAQPPAFRILLSRAVSAGGEPASDRILEGGVEGSFGCSCDEGELTISGDGCDGGDELRGLSAVEAAAAVVYGSSDDEGGDVGDRSSESAEGSTTSDEDDMEGTVPALTSHAMGLGLGMDVEPHSLLTVAAAAKPELPKYLPPHKRDLAGAGAGGKYIPPALRAARAEAAAANELPKYFSEGSMRGGFESGGDGEEGDGEGGRLPDGMLSPQFNVSEDEPEDDDGDDVIFDGLETDESPSSSQFFEGGGPSCSSSGATSVVDSIAETSGVNPVGDAGASGEAAGEAGVLHAVLPNGQIMPWIAARRDHYYTGDYHSRLPCSPGAACNVKGGGCGGGGVPSPHKRDQNTAICSSDPGVSDTTNAQGIDNGENPGGSGVASGNATSGPRGEAGGSHLYAGGVSLNRGKSGEECDFPPSDGVWWTCGAWSILGRREKQEDRFMVVPDFTKAVGKEAGSSDHESQRSTPQGGDASPAEGRQEAPATEGMAKRGLAKGFFGVYDGHCGSEAVQFVCDRLHSIIGEHGDLQLSPNDAIRDSCLAADKEFLAMAGEGDWFSGTTVLVALMQGRKLTVGNIGDGEAVLARADRVVGMSPVHNPGRKDESERITRANGWVTTEQELFLRQLKQMDLNDPQIRMAATDHVRWTTITRVCGELAVSRSIGDRDFKGFTKRRIEEDTEGVAPLEMSVFAWPRGHSRKFRDDLLTAEPEFASTEIVPGDEFLLMACDGVWDVLGKEEAVENARKFFEEGLCAQVVAERMCELAYRMGTSDNVTVVVVQFHYEAPGL